MADRPGDGTIAGVRVWRPLLSPSRRWPLSTDFLTALVSFGLTLSLWGQGLRTIDTLIDVATYLCVFVGNFALLWRRSHPLHVHYTVLGASVLVQLGAMSDGIVALAFSLYSVGRHEANSRNSLVAMMMGLGFVATDALVLSKPSISGALACVTGAAVWYAGRRLRFRVEYLRLLEERAAYLERERHVEAERAVAAERTRIAREMHDIVAHQLSLMTVQAGAAKTVSASDPEAAREAMAAVEKAGRQAVSEMRHLLGVLRPASVTDELGPQPSLADLPALAAEVGEVGPLVRLTMAGDTSRLPARLELNIYRIVQEALTNVIRHAGDGVTAQVSIEVLGNRVSVRVRDDGKGEDVGLSGGHGLVGMRERAELLDGHLWAGPRAEGGFEVRATFPHEARGS